MESLGEILKRLQRQNTFAGEGYPTDLIVDEVDVELCPLCGGRGWVRDDLPVGRHGFGKAVPCECQIVTSQAQRLLRLQRFSNIGQLGQISFDTTLPEGRGVSPEARTRFSVAFDAAQKYGADPNGWFILIGSSGSGKTHLAAAIANVQMTLGSKVFFALVPDLLDYLRGTFSLGNGGRTSDDLSYDEFFEQIKSVDLLVLDDLGAQNGTSWADEKLFQVLNHRYVNKLPTVITTNISLEHMDSRVQSRVVDPQVSVVLDLGVALGQVSSLVGNVEPEMLRQMNFENFEIQTKVLNREARETLTAALTAAKSFSQDPQGWLVLLGDSGCGKTHLAVAVAAERLKYGYPVFFAFVPDLLDHLRYAFNPESRVTYDELFDKVKQSPLLILDDLGAESSTAWAHEKLYQIIVHRHNAKLPTVVTTRGIPNSPKDPIASRINDPRLVTVVPITAPDYRQQGRKFLAPGDALNDETLAKRD